LWKEKYITYTYTLSRIGLKGKVMFLYIAYPFFYLIFVGKKKAKNRARREVKNR